MSVTAKFKVGQTVTTDRGNGPQVQVKLVPDYGEGKNTEWAAATPSGAIDLTIDPAKTEAAEFFKPGREVTVTFS